MLDLLRTTSFDLRLLPSTWRDLLHISRGLDREPFVGPLSQRLRGEGREARWARCLLRAFALTYEDRGEWLTPTLREATQLLDEDPADLLLGLIRAGLLLRAGRLAEAEGALTWLRRELPEHSQVTFYELLLGAARRAPAEELVPLLERLEREQFQLWAAKNWTVKHFPELEPYARLPAFKPLLGALDRR